MDKLEWDDITRLAKELGLEIGDANSEMRPGIYAHGKGKYPQRLNLEDLMQICLYEDFTDIWSEEDYTDFNQINYEFTGNQSWSFSPSVFTVKIDYQHSFFAFQDQNELERGKVVA
ncbi:MAG: hypothetical protein PHT79_07660 [Syntrophomonadaceae bacterium]|nr:hypothetical protein [Syntrophomonadaceae bacterium]MDD4549615.1 hypothetical protein [Syntrophomonadaceae bacterium]